MNLNANETTGQSKELVHPPSIKTAEFDQNSLRSSFGLNNFSDETLAGLRLPRPGSWQVPFAVLGLTKTFKPELVKEASLREFIRSASLEMRQHLFGVAALVIGQKVLIGGIILGYGLATLDPQLITIGAGAMAIPGVLAVKFWNYAKNCYLRYILHALEMKEASLSKSNNTQS